MSKRGVFWGLGGLLGVALVTLCILLVTVMGTGAQNSSQSSVEPQVTNLPTGETSDYEIAESPEVGQRAPSDQPPFQPNDRPSVALGPLPSESPPQASFTASSSTVATGETGTNDLITATITASDTAENETATVTIQLSSPLPGGLTLADDDVKLVLVNTADRADDVVGSSWNIVDVLGDGMTAVVMVPLVDDMILEFDEEVELELRVSSKLTSHVNSNTLASGRFNIIDNEDDTITIVLLDGLVQGAETTVVEERIIYLPVVKLAPGVLAGADISTRYRIEFDDPDENGNVRDENGNVRNPASGDDILQFTNNRSRDLMILEGNNSGVPNFDESISIKLGDPEETEVFKLVPRPLRFGPAGLFTIPTAELYITILDQNTLTYEIRGADEIDENAGSYTVQLRRTGMITADAMVPYTVSGGDSSPASAADFVGNVFPSGSFTFSGYDALSDEVSIMIKNDGFSGDTETFKISVTGGTPTTTKEVAIIDDDPPGMPVPQLSLHEIASIREGLAGLVTATLDIASGQTITVELTPSHTDAQPADYSTPTTLIAVIPPGEMTATFTIMATHDMIYEGPEMLEFTLSVVGGGAGVTEPRSRQLLILDADPVPSISFGAPTSTIEEDAANRRHGVGLKLSGALDNDIEVTFTVAGSATRGPNADYTLAADTVTIQAGDKDRIILLDVNNDDLYDGRPHETVVLRLVSATGGVTVNDPKSEHTVTITDDEDAPMVTLDPISPSVREGGVAIFTVTLSHGVDETVTLELAVSNGISENEDYARPDSETQLSVTIGDGETTGELSLKTNGDNVYEGDETVVLSLSATSGAENVMGLPISRELTITEENKPPVLSLSGPSAVSENDASVVFKAMLSGDLLEAGLEVELAVVGGDAVLGGTAGAGDYTLSPAQATIQGGQREVEFTLNTNDNEISYGDKTVELELRKVSGPVVPLGVVKRTLTIEEDEAVPQLSLHEIASIREGMAGLVTATLDIASGRTITVELTPSHTDAKLADYSTPTTLRAMIPPGEFTATFTIMATPDGIYEGPEMLEFMLSVVGGGAGVTEPRSRQLSILDADLAPSISFVVTDSMIREDTPSQRHGVGLQLSGPLEDEIEVTFTVAGSATRSGMNADYTLAATTVTIPPETSDAIILLDINNDDLYEGADDTVVLTLTSATGDVTVGTPSGHTVMIIDDEDAPMVIFDTGSSMVAEGGTANVEVELDGDLHESDVVVSFTIGGTAVAGTDYTSPGSSVTIPAGMRSAMITFNIATDQRYEGADETVVLTLTSATGDVTVGTPSVHTVTIDETAPTVTFDTGSSTVAEGGTANVEVELDGDLHGSDVVVSFTIGGTAVAGADFTSPVTSVTIPAGERSAMITFNIDADQRYEGADETVVLTLTSATGDVTLGATSVHTVTIMDAETAPTVIFDTGSSMVAEGGTANVEVELDGDLHESAVVVSFTVGGTAVAGTDYTSPVTSVTIPAGMRSAMITFAITSDSSYEGADDTVVLTLTSATGDVTVGATSVHTVTIDETAPTVIFDTGSSMVAEGGTANVEVELDGDLHESDVVVSFTVGGTAVAGTDYTSPGNSVTIPAGMLVPL